MNPVRGLARDKVVSPKGLGGTTSNGMNTKFKDIVKLFQKLPGVGPRQAARFVIALMDKPEEELREFGKAVANLRKEISFCPVCFNISDNGLCSVCLDGKRDQAKLLVVEKVTDLDSIER